MEHRDRDREKKRTNLHIHSLFNGRLCDLAIVKSLYDVRILVHLKHYNFK